MTVKLAIPLLLLLLPMSVAAQTVTSQGVDPVGDLTLKVSQAGVVPGSSVLYGVNAAVAIRYQCTRKGRSIPLDIMAGTEWFEEWTAQAKATGTIRTAKTLLLPDMSNGLCSAGWTAEPTWVQYYNLFLVDISNGGDVVLISSYERTLK